ncbi:MAG: hypothetical protein M0Z93_12140 [Actinomycetota bacterium]|nr:hypothetical protein [Actinomycetota bacterium]
MGGDGSRERVRYRFGPLERRGLVAGWRGGQVLVVATGLVVATAFLRGHPTVGGVLLALVGVAVSAGLATWPLRGRTGDQWLPLVVRWLASGLGGRRSVVTVPPTFGAPPHPGRVGHVPAPGARLSWRLPASGSLFPAISLDARATIGPFRGLAIRATPLPDAGNGPRAGIVVDDRARTVTAVLAVPAGNFALLGPAEQDARVAAWSQVLASLAREGSDIQRVQWIETSLPDHGEGVRAHLRRSARHGPDTAPGASYASLVERSMPTTRRHRVLLALSVRMRRETGTGSRRGPAGADRLVRELGQLHSLLGSADVDVEGVLSDRMVAGACREAVATMAELERPEVTAAVADAAPDGGGAGGIVVGRSPAWPWPTAMDVRWDSLRTDGTWHATYWIAEWPRQDVAPDFLAPLLLAPVRRSLSLVMEPVAPARAAREVARARTSDLADRELRRRGGFLVTARQNREREGVERRDAELADGHAQYRYSGYVTVTAETRDGLRDACAAAEQAAGQSRMELRLLYGEQDVAFACTLPLARGLG